MINSAKTALYGDGQQRQIWYERSN